VRRGLFCSACPGILFKRISVSQAVTLPVKRLCIDLRIPTCFVKGLIPEGGGPLLEWRLGNVGYASSVDV
jgi:hypothetical protein